MRQIYPPYLDFRVDKLTSSVQHVTSGEVLDIMVSLAIWLPTHVSYLLNKNTMASYHLWPNRN